jgi:photosystem II stability/assembly factor-like uncharacterized protein
MVAAMTKKAIQRRAGRARRGWQASIGRNLAAVPRSRTFRRALVGPLLALFVLALAAPAAQAGEVPSEWTWTDYGPALRDVSCAAPGKCVAVGQRGMILRSSADGDDSLAWSRIPIEYPEELAGVTCTSGPGAFCLAVSNRRTAPATFESKVYRSTDGGATWSAGVALPADGPVKTKSALALACDPGGDSCYAVGPAGGVWRSADGGGSWIALELPTKPGAYDHLACPAAGVCVAAGGAEVGSSAVIEGTAVTSVPLPKKLAKGINALACDSATRCTVADGLTDYTSLDIPTQEYGPVRLFPKKAEVTSLSCPRENECVGLATSVALRTKSLSAGTWTRRPLGTGSLKTIDCTGADCVAIGDHAAWYTGSDLGLDWDQVNEVAKFEVADCPAGVDGTCVAGADKDLGYTRTGGRLWKEPLSEYTGLNILAINCSGRSECLFVGKTMTLFTKDLESFKARHPTITDPMGTKAVTCVTKEICVGVNGGVTYTTLDGAVTDWTQNSFPETPSAIACMPGRTDVIECVATTRELLAVGTMTHEDDQVHWRWRYADVEPEAILGAVGCSHSQCTAAGKEGVLLTSNGTDLMHWTEHVFPNPETVPALRPEFKSVVCPADGVCLAGGIKSPKSFIASTKDEWKTWSFDELEGIEGANPTVAGFGCETVDRCVAVGGTALVGVRHPSP